MFIFYMLKNTKNDTYFKYTRNGISGWTTMSLASVINSKKKIVFIKKTYCPDSTIVPIFAVIEKFDTQFQYIAKSIKTGLFLANKALRRTGIFWTSNMLKADRLKDRNKYLHPTLKSMESNEIEYIRIVTYLPYGGTL